MTRPVTFERGRYLEDFEVGAVYEHPWSRTLNAGDNSLFSTVTMNFNPLYFSAEAARVAGLPDVLVCPLLVMNVVFGLSVEDLSEKAIAHLGYWDVRFGVPVHPGDTLSSSSRVLSARPSESRADRGVVHVRTTGRNQRGEVVISYERKILVRRRPPAEGAQREAAE